MANGAEAVRLMELQWSWGLGLRLFGQPRKVQVHIAQIACPELVEGPGSQSTPFRAARPNPLTPCAAPSEREAEKSMGRGKYEKSFDNCCAALVSRERRAPRAERHRKSCMVNELRLMSPLTTARGAQVSRAARGRIEVGISTTMFSRYRLRCVSFPSRRRGSDALQNAGTVEWPVLSVSRRAPDVPNVTRCHTHAARDRIHKMIHHDQLCHLGASNVTGFPAAREILGHFGNMQQRDGAPVHGRAARLKPRTSFAAIWAACPERRRGMQHRQNAKNVAFGCILLHGVASGVSRW